MSNNPFLDPPPRPQQYQPPQTKSGPDMAADIFNEMSLLDGPIPSDQGIIAPAQRSGTLPIKKPANRDRSLVATTRSSTSPHKGPLQKARPRGASESSVMDRERDLRRGRERAERAERPQRTESEERRRRERRKEREERHRREKEKLKKGEKPAKGPRGLDIIDKLDVTGIYGQGLFHHDGPFDACNPHRNKAKYRNAPMQAFPTDSMNMRLGGSGPLNKTLNLDLIHGRGEESFEAYSSARKNEPQYFDAKQKADPVHGEETAGLGTSTFLEGAPVSRREIQRRESNEPQSGDIMGIGGLQRKKSLVQRLRGGSQARRRAGSNADDFRSPDALYQNPEAVFDASPPPNKKAISAGGPVRTKYTKENEINPFDNDYEAAYEKKSAQIKEQELGVGRSRATSSPRGNILQRSITADSTPGGKIDRSSDEQERQGRSGVSTGGLLSRMRSLKGGPRKPRYDRHVS